MQKKWIKIEQGAYQLSIDDAIVAEMKIDYNSLKGNAEISIGNETYLIKRTGFWKTGIEITNSAGKIILKVYNDKWYANSSVLEYSDKKYTLKVRNNPLVEWAIIDDDKKDLLAYGLSNENRINGVKITANNVENILLFDCLLWYLFVPIAEENSSDSLLFLMLAAS